MPHNQAHNHNNRRPPRHSHRHRNTRGRPVVPAEATPEPVVTNNTYYAGTFSEPPPASRLPMPPAHWLNTIVYDQQQRPQNNSNHN